MREKRNFAARTQAPKHREVRKKYFLVYEGQETEEGKQCRSSDIRNALPDLNM